MSNKMFFYQLCSAFGLMIYAMNSIFLIAITKENPVVITTTILGFIFLFTAFAIGLHQLEKDQS